ncbi:MAG TPA: beta-ketoacyl synthase chain length factor [Bacteroidia bacterium]|nr:beta-ketoacyl synthase chain length factor [Bacteroidia bacterium]
MTIYINGTGCISHQNTIDADAFFENREIDCLPLLVAQEPDYKGYVPANMLRRMSHIIKMGVAAAKISLQQAELENVDAIITGTGLGCFEDTTKFLKTLIENNEQLLTPTSFIQSTHNTVAGQIALLIKCHNYNFTYTQQGMSFESALVDAMMFLNENKNSNILVGGLDEAIQPYYDLLVKAGHIKKQEDVITEIEKNKTHGFCLGEGASFFVLSNQKNKTTKAQIKGLKTFTFIKGADDLQNKLTTFLRGIDLSINDLNLVLSGNSGDAEDDTILNESNRQLFSKIDIVYFKPLCGEYFTASAFALWLASAIIEKQKVPKVLIQGHSNKKDLKTILIVNQYRNTEYSFMCVSSC